MADPIDRQAAIDAINSYFGFSIEEEYGSAVQEVINGLPSAEPRWIPVGEQLPVSSGNYLVSIRSIGWNCKEHVVNDIAYWSSSEGFHKKDEVVAWMLLPEPYKGEDDG